MEDVRRRVFACRRCGKDYGNNAIGFGQTPADLLMVGMNPWVRNHKFADGKGITILKKWLGENRITSFWFDNVVKCEMPGDFKPDETHSRNCLPFLRRQITYIKPSVIVSFGNFATRSLGFDPDSGCLGNFKSVPVYHVKHFSSPVYDGSTKSYYKDLWKLFDRILIDDIPF